MTYLTLAIIAASESVVHLLRYRAVHGDPRWSGLTTTLVAFLRIAFLLTGVMGVMREANVVGLLLSYAVTAGVVTWLFQGWLERRKEPTA